MTSLRFNVVEKAFQQISVNCGEKRFRGKAATRGCT